MTTREKLVPVSLPPPQIPHELVCDMGLARIQHTEGVPLATEPGISLIILTPMKILQRNLNRGTFVV
jgi:hypothetical protein